MRVKDNVDKWDNSKNCMPIIWTVTKIRNCVEQKIYAYFLGNFCNIEERIQTYLFFILNMYLLCFVNGKASRWIRLRCMRRGCLAYLITDFSSRNSKAISLTCISIQYYTKQFHIVKWNGRSITNDIVPSV